MVEKLLLNDTKMNLENELGISQNLLGYLALAFLGVDCIS